MCDLVTTFIYLAEWSITPMINLYYCTKRHDPSRSQNQFTTPPAKSHTRNHMTDT